MKLPVIIILALIPLVLTAYAEAPSHVDVYDYPFNITLLEGGNFTLYNNATNNIYFDGAFSGMVYCGSISGNPDCDGFDNSKTFELPADVFTPNTYYLNDKTYLDTNLISTITIENPTPVYVAPPTPEPIDEPTDMTTYNDLMVIPPPIPYCVNDPEWCEHLESLENSAPITNSTSGESVEEIESTKSTDIEILDLRLQILKVIESIFKIVFQ
jgi:hypothetical protein